MNAARDSLDWMHDLKRLAHHVENALEYSGGTHELLDVVVGVGEGRYQMWPGQDSIIITEIVNFPKKRVCNFFLAGGSLEELEPMVPMIEAWAKEQGCNAISLVGRKGWTRSFLRDRGYTVIHCEMAKEI